MKTIERSTAKWNTESAEADYRRERKFKGYSNNVEGSR